MYSITGIVVIESIDFVLLPVYLFLVLFFAFILRNATLRDSPMGRYFIPALLLKIIGGLAIGLIYAFYYDGGDTFYYFYDSLAFNIALRDGITQLFQLFMLPSQANDIYLNQYTTWLTYFHDSNGWAADKIFGVLSIISFHSYWVMSVLMSCLSFSGAWALYRTFVKLNPNLYRQLAICVLFVPSVFFWGSGVLKDSIAFGCLGWITYSSYQIFFRSKSLFSNILLLLITGYIALKVKPYIIISFVPALLFWIFLTYRSRIGVKFARVMSGPAIAMISIFFGYLMIQRIGDEFQQFSLQNVLSTSQSYQVWHSYLAQNEHASGYSLGNIDGSWQSILKAAPAAITVTLFQPFLWQAHSVVVLLSALESTFILGFTLYIFWKNGFRRVFLSILNNPNVFFCFFFSILFAFSVGFTAYNFGALVRYKIPCIPFFLMGLVILNHLTAEERKKINLKKQEEAESRKFKRKFSPPAPIPSRSF